MVNKGVCGVGVGEREREKTGRGGKDRERRCCGDRASGQKN